MLLLKLVLISDLPDRPLLIDDVFVVAFVVLDDDDDDDMVEHGVVRGADKFSFLKGPDRGGNSNDGVVAVVVSSWVVRSLSLGFTRSNSRCLTVGKFL